jgi:hypothetical protein
MLPTSSLQHNREYYSKYIIISATSFVDDVAKHFIGSDQINQRATKEILLLLSTLHTHADDNLTGFGFGSFLPDGPMIQLKGVVDLLDEF